MNSGTAPGPVESRQRLESEVKFLVEDLASYREALQAAGARLVHARVHEHNVRFDTPDDALLQRRELLRLRRDTAIRLTFKGMPAEAIASEARVREELEVHLDDFDLAAALLQRLGFQARQVYEKYRETFHWRRTEIVLDELPFGSFVEIEGEEDDIKEAAAVLQLDWTERILTNYLSLMADLKEQFQLPFDDLTFANFAGTPVRISDLLD